MSLPKRTSRPIEVSGRHYRWMVRLCLRRSEPGHCLRLTVQDQVTEELLQREFPEHVGFDADNEPIPNTVSPGDVKAFILERF
jgi:hypothetical protein